MSNWPLEAALPSFPVLVSIQAEKFVLPPIFISTKGMIILPAG